MCSCVNLAESALGQVLPDLEVSKREMLAIAICEDLLRLFALEAEELFYFRDAVLDIVV